jgi:hypothetical protein
MVALLQNSQTRNDQATQHKLNAIADGLADLMERMSGDDTSFKHEIQELKLAVGLEQHESTSGQAADAAAQRGVDNRYPRAAS